MTLILSVFTGCGAASSAAPAESPRPAVDTLRAVPERDGVLRVLATHALARDVPGARLIGLDPQSSTAALWVEELASQRGRVSLWIVDYRRGVVSARYEGPWTGPHTLPPCRARALGTLGTPSAGDEPIGCLTGDVERDLILLARLARDMHDELDDRSASSSTGLVVSPGGELAATVAVAPARVTLVDLRHDRVQFLPLPSASDWTMRPAFSRDGRAIALGARAMDAASDELRLVIVPLDGPVTSIPIPSDSTGSIDAIAWIDEHTLLLAHTSTSTGACLLRVRLGTASSIETLRCMAGGTPSFLHQVPGSREDLVWGSRHGDEYGWARPSTGEIRTTRVRWGRLLAVLRGPRLLFSDPPDGPRTDLLLVDLASGAQTRLRHDRPIASLRSAVDGSEEVLLALQVHLGQLEIMRVEPSTEERP